MENYQDTAYLQLANDTIYTRCQIALGGAYLVFPGEIEFTPLADEFTIEYDYVNGRTKILIYSTKHKFIQPGSYPILKLDNPAYPEKFETAGYRGEIVTSIIEQ